MSRTLSSISPNTAYVSPNQLVTAQLATNVGFNPNDYVYAYGNNQVGNLGSTIGVGLVSTFIAGTRVNGAVQTGFAPTAVMSGPYSATATYTGATRTQGTIFQATTNFSTNNATTLRTCVLSSGNIAAIFRDSTAGDLKIAVFTNAGASVKAATTISSQTSAGATGSALSISAMTDGGFVVAYTSNVQCFYQRFNSAGNTVVSETALPSNLASALSHLNIAAGLGGGFAIVGNGTNGQLYFQAYSSSNTYITELAIGNASTVTFNAIVGLSNGNFAVGAMQSSNVFNIALVSASATQIQQLTSVTNGTNEQFNMAAYEGGFVSVFRSPFDAMVRLSSHTNSGTTVSSGITNGISSANPSVCVGENNIAYVMFLNNNTGVFNIAPYNSINSGMTLGTIFSTSGYTPGNYTSNNLYSALNGSLYYGAFFSSRASFTTINYNTYTQNTTVLSNTSFYTPTNGYYFLGIGATTAAANSSGLIYTNGGIALPSTYPSVSTGYAFDYQSNSYWAQRGTINGRAINLQGAQ
jgi:hypothetical protein